MPQPYYQDDLVTLHHGDARALPLPDESVDLIVTSPPYFGLRDYGHDTQIGAEATPREFIDALIACTREMVRVLKPSGSIFVNLGDKYAQKTERSRNGIAACLEGGKPLRTTGDTVTRPTPSYGVPAKSLTLLPERYRIAAVDELGLIARAVIVWSKPNGLPESVTDRVRRSHEDWVHLTKSPRYFAAVDELREPHTMKPQRRGVTRPYGDGQQVARSGRELRTVPTTDGNPLGKLPGSVWSIATQPLRVPSDLGVDHFAAFPMEWPRRLILGWSPEGGTVLDPFGGTGTTALVAAMHGRQGISVDASADYCRLAQWRVNDPKQRERASRAAETKPPTTNRGAKVMGLAKPQTDLFDLPA